ncbi:unnamed protein product [Soboliphyme baturini]|uniref:IgGFc_binding domain-containing protein n=1 Tax=Soboliphyme baturini TaxID=241478 RepID=A0A183IL59_9BILA|nr:unnamed protein product [Soboliphyme baturini]
MSNSGILKLALLLALLHFAFTQKKAFGISGYAVSKSEKITVQYFWKAEVDTSTTEDPKMAEPDEVLSTFRTTRSFPLKEKFSVRSVWVAATVYHVSPLGYAYFIVPAQPLAESEAGIERMRIVKLVPPFDEYFIKPDQIIFWSDTESMVKNKIALLRIKVTSSASDRAIRSVIVQPKLTSSLHNCRMSMMTLNNRTDAIELTTTKLSIVYNGTDQSTKKNELNTLLPENYNASNGIIQPFTRIDQYSDWLEQALRVGMKSPSGIYLLNGRGEFTADEERLTGVRAVTEKSLIPVASSRSVFVFLMIDGRHEARWCIGTAYHTSTEGYAFFIVPALPFTERTTNMTRVHIMSTGPSPSEYFIHPDLIIFWTDSSTRYAWKIALVRIKIVGKVPRNSIAPAVVQHSLTTSLGECQTPVWDSNPSRILPQAVSRTFSIEYSGNTKPLKETELNARKLTMNTTSECKNMIGQPLLCNYVSGKNATTVMAGILLKENCGPKNSSVQPFTRMDLYADWLERAVKIAPRLQQGSYIQTDGGILTDWNEMLIVPECSWPRQEGNGQQLQMQHHEIRRFADQLLLEVTCGDQVGLAVIMSGNTKLERYFLAPAHLFADKRVPFHRLEVRTFDMQENAPFHLSGVALHKRYSPTGEEYDIALGLITNSSGLSVSENDVCIPSLKDDMKKELTNTFTWKDDKMVIFPNFTTVPCSNNSLLTFCANPKQTHTDFQSNQIRPPGPLVDRGKFKGIEYPRYTVVGLPSVNYVKNVNDLMKRCGVKSSTVLCPASTYIENVYTDVSKFSSWIQKAKAELRDRRNLIYV